MGEIYVLNSPILTTYGRYKYEKIEIGEARGLLLFRPFTSAIGHEGTAKFLSQLIGKTIPMNRTSIHMEVGDEAIVFKLLARLPEGKVLTEEELKSIPYELGILVRDE